MARIAVEQTALTDLRFQALARLIHRDRDAALGLMVGLWNQCQELERHSLTRDEIADLRPDKKGLADALLASQLATLQEDGSLYIRGTNGRIEWLKRAREAGRQGGHLGGRPQKPPGDTQEGYSMETQGGNYGKTPPSPSPAPSPAPTKKKTCAPSARDDGFETFWKAYPRKRSKGSAEKAWKKLHPDATLAKAILAAIECARASKDWQKEGGEFVPYPASWLNAKGWEDDLGTGDPRKDVLF